MMKIALPHWQGRISPVFDVAQNLLIVETDGHCLRQRQEMVVPLEPPRLRALRLLEIQTQLLICGAISWPFELAIKSAGIQLVSHICGDIEQVLTAFLENSLHQGAFWMPGCCGRRHQLRSGRGWRGRHR